MSLESKAKTLAELSVERKKWQDAFTMGALGNQQAYAYARDNRHLYEQQTKYVPLAEAQKQLDIATHNAEVLLKVADTEIAKLKAIVYCQCDEPDFNKFGMDNQCAKCGKVIEDYPLNCEKETKKGVE